jgi:hypothetical protein
MASRPVLEGTSFGSITASGRTYDHDILIRLDGTVEKRRRDLSRAVYGSSHTVSLDEAGHVYQEGAGLLVVGSGQYGALKLSDEAARFFEGRGCEVRVEPTPGALEVWNAAPGNSIGLFHVTC